MFRVFATMDQRMPLSAVAAHARRAEALGYDGLNVPEAVHDGLAAAAIALEATARLHVATSVLVAFPRSPMTVAHAAWDLQEFSRGRFELGLGSQVRGNIVGRYSTPWTAPVPRMREYVQSLRAIFACWQEGAPLAFEGEHYRFTRMQPFFNPGPIEHPDIKIIISAVNTFNARLAGEVCDGIAIHGFSTFKYIQEVLIPAVHEGARRAGKNPADLQIRGGGMLATGRNEEEVEAALEVVRRRISFYGSTRSYSNVLKLHGWDDEAAHLHRLSIDGKWDEMVDVVTDEMVEEFAVVGTWDDIAGKLRETYAGINTQIGFAADPQNPDEEAQVKEILADLKQIPNVGEATGS